MKDKWKTKVDHACEETEGFGKGRRQGQVVFSEMKYSTLLRSATLGMDPEWTEHNMRTKDGIGMG